MLKKGFLFLLFFYGIFCNSQELEESIYSATESFISNQNQITFQELDNQSIDFKNRISTPDEQLAFVFLLCNKGYYLKGTNNATDAILAYEDAWKRYSDNKLSGYDIIEYCLKPLGELYTVSKDYANAESTITQYLFLAKKEGDNSQMNAAFINLSIVYQSLGKHRDVIKMITDALNSSTPTIVQRQKMTNIKMDSQLALGQVLSVEEIPKSITYDYYLKRSQLDLQNGDFREAEVNFEQSKKLFLTQENVTARMLAKFYLNETQLFLKVKKTDKALNSLSKALYSLLPNFKGEPTLSREDLYKENTFIDIFDLYGDLESDVEQALEYYDLSFYMADLLSENISSQETKIVNQVANRTRSEKCIELLFERYKKTKDAKFLTRAFLYAENSKAAVLKENLQKKSLLQLHPRDEDLKKEQRLLQEQEFLINELVKEQIGKKRVSVLNNLWRDQTKNSFKLREVKKEILKKYPPLERQPLSINDLQEQLMKDKATLVEYFYGKRAMYQFAFNAEDAFFFKIELDDELKKDISRFVHFFDDASAINNNVKKYTTQAFKTYQSLRLKPFSSAKNLLIIPDGLLNFIPFESLLTSPTESSNFSKMPFLLKDHKIGYNSSAEFYLKERNKRNQKKLLGVFPVYKNSDQELRYSIEESESIDDQMDATLMMNDKATKENFIGSADNFDILHLSTHASGGSFSVPATIEFHDESMNIYELYGLQLNPKLVVLSACETGVGKLQRGEGAMSIARGFQYAGAHNVLFSLWQINDRSTANIMELFYKRFDNHASVHVANHEAKIMYLEDDAISNIKKSPYYWSAFMYYGELSAPHSVNYILYIGIALILVLLVLFVRRKQSNIK